jgi:hypothetical protein
MPTADNEPNRPRDEIERTQQGDEATEEELEPMDAGQQDFAARNVIMTNTLQGGASPAAGGVIGTGGALSMEPTTDDDQAEDAEREGLPPHERR